MKNKLLLALSLNLLIITAGCNINNENDNLMDLNVDSYNTNEEISDIENTEIQTNDLNEANSSVNETEPVNSVLSMEETIINAFNDKYGLDYSPETVTIDSAGFADGETVIVTRIFNEVSENPINAIWFTKRLRVYDDYAATFYYQKFVEKYPNIYNYQEFPENLSVTFHYPQSFENITNDSDEAFDKYINMSEMYIVINIYSNEALSEENIWQINDFLTLISQYNLKYMFYINVNNQNEIKFVQNDLQESIEEIIELLK